MAFGYGYGFWLWAKLKRIIAQPPQGWIIDGSEVQQAPSGPTVIWTVNGSNVSNTEV